jgi:hypothetical protein
MGYEDFHTWVIDHAFYTKFIGLLGQDQGQNSTWFIIFLEHNTWFSTTTIPNLSLTIFSR